jgi:hypothetical protein
VFVFNKNHLASALAWRGKKKKKKKKKKTPGVARWKMITMGDAFDQGLVVNGLW